MKSFGELKIRVAGASTKKIGIFLLVFLFIGLALVRPTLALPVEVVTPVVVGVDVPGTAAAVKQTFWQTAVAAIEKAGSLAFHRTLASALNKIAYDAANYIGSGGQGQKPLFLTQSLGGYLGQIGDEAAGQYIESFVNNLNAPDNANTCSSDLDEYRDLCYEMTVYPNTGYPTNGFNTIYDCYAAADKEAVACAAKNNISNPDQATPSFNVCSPSSLEAKLKIGLGLVDQNRPQGPNCTASRMINNWKTDINQKWKDFQSATFLEDFVGIFDPRANDLGIYTLAYGDMQIAASNKKDNVKTGFLANQGWLDVRNIAGEAQGVPGEAQREMNAASDARQAALGKTTSDILVDAANLFLNQLYVSSLNNLLQNLGDKTNSARKSNPTNRNSDPGSGKGEVALKEVTTKLLQANFGQRADYDILSQLAICINVQNPGPDNCAIDDKFLQAITEKKTVAEAAAGGYLHDDWQFTDDDSGNSYNSSYSRRNIAILRKYRILPVGWEEAGKRATDPDRPKKVTLNDLLACFSPDDEYTQFSSNFNTSDQSWCEGLIDPNWVLKAPLNYCQKQGVGAQILNKTVTPGTGTTTPSQLNITRAEDYCADGQTCIKEKSNGSCDAYGYCNEEKRIWNFGTDSCQPIDNTCGSFVNDNGASFSYLENTLDYGTCNPENAGCRQYALGGVYSTSTGTINWDGSNSLYLNKNLTSCSGQDEGCTGLLRLKPTWGSNLVMDADFMNDQLGASSTGPTLNDWPLTGVNRATIVDAGLEPGGASGRAIKIITIGSGGIYSSSVASLLPLNLQLIPGQAYTLSADVYVDSSGVIVSLVMGSAADGFAKTTSASGSWQHLTVTRPATSSYNEPNFSVVSNLAATFYLKNLKFEMSDWDTGFSSYGAFKIQEKILPAYLEKTCYVDASSATKNYNLKSNAPAVCSNFARKCNREDVNCELYTAIKDRFAVSAQVTSGDYCAQQCVGYDVYIAKASYFNSPSAENMIPKNAKSCSADVAGCSEFTNLDSLAKGGEQQEYYTSLKQCIKPNTADCASFYSWEGRADGYQLQTYTLKKDALGQPFVTSDDSALCSADIYRLPTSDPFFNPDCREFYNAAGQISYHLVSRTVTCSDNCHAYRMSDKNIDPSLAQAACAGPDKHWNGSNCNVCLNGGAWNDTYQSCLYQAIPGEGQTCQAQQNGCREYNGNGGSNVRLTATADFENGLDGWYSNCTNGLATSTVANSNNGHSLQYNNGATPCQPVGGNSASAAQLDLNSSLTQGKAYTLKFMARGAADTNLQIYFINKDTTTGAKALFNEGNPLAIRGNEWQVYQINLANLDHAVGNQETLVISGGADFFLDNPVLSEITDRYYLIKNSSQIPDVCYYDSGGHYQGAEYNLGCAQYADRSGLTHNLRKFTKLCSDSSVGCEQMIDTKNYSPYGAGFWLNGEATSTCLASDPGCVRVATDTALYAVYDETKRCGSADQGCSRLGEGQGGENATSWSDVFKNNNPDQYNTTLCSRANVGCEEWNSSTDNTKSYFRDPGFNTCAYRTSKDPTIPGKVWYKIPAKRCDLNDDKTISGNAELGSPVCLNDGNCGGKRCILDNNDYPCSISYLKTIGLGGAGNQVPVPDQAAGLCNAGNSGCTEYIDPVTKFAVNLVTNPNYKTTANSTTTEGWGSSQNRGRFKGNFPTDNQQIIFLTANKLYSFNTSPSGAAGSVTLEFIKDARPLLVDNSFGTSTNRLEITAAPANQPIIFNALDNKIALLTGGNTNKTIEIKELALDYQLTQNIDKTSCNGLAKFDNGCILFNERAMNGALGLKSLATGWDAYATEDGKTPVACDPNSPGLSCNSNQLVKVRPDRVCSKWLDCTTYVQNASSTKKTCYALGECDRLDDQGECVSFTAVSTSTRRFTPELDKNATGYAILDKYNFSVMREVGSNLNKHYDFEDLSGVELSCRLAASNTPCGFIPDIKESLVTEPAAPPNGAPTDYPAEGKNYLKVPVNVWISPQGSASTSLITVNNGTYYLNYLANTKKSSGLKARAIIANKDGDIIIDSVTHQPLLFDDNASSGWVRFVKKFTISGGLQGIRIYLASDSSDPVGPNVYFDDINLEPVLEMAPGDYAVPECRLYPEADSLGCTSKNENTISSGLEGYCLQHDSANPQVCQLWYPIDKISSANNEQSTLGYQGKAPLDYCTDVSGNFDVVEKRKGYFSYETSFDKEKNVCNGRLWFQDGDPGPCYDRKCDTKYPNAGMSICVLPDDWYGFSCPECPADYNTWFSWKSRDSGDSYLKVTCTPKTNLLLPYFQSTKLGRDLGDGNWEYCGDKPFQVGYGKYNGFQGPYEATNLSPAPAIRVYDYNGPHTLESDLKLISRDPDGNLDDSHIFRLTCNRFLQTVKASGENKAWSNRISINSRYSTDTPTFFIDDHGDSYRWDQSGNGYELSGYGRNRQDLPFGAALLPDNFSLANSPPIYLRNRYASIDDPSAGRPYGCSQGTGANCGIIGACHNDPNIYCLVGDPTLATATCGSGSCDPFWSQSLPLLNLYSPIPPFSPMPPYHFENLLRSLFITSYSAYTLNNGTYSQSTVPSDVYPDYFVNLRSPFQNDCPYNGGESLAHFCSVFPILSHINLYYNDDPTTSLSGGPAYDIRQAGLYRLQFNSKVSPEQQPLKEIRINWGDGNTQIITSQDQRPATSTPHVIYHQYTTTDSAMRPEVTITDNWGAWCKSWGGNQCFR